MIPASKTLREISESLQKIAQANLNSMTNVKALASMNNEWTKDAGETGSRQEHKIPLYSQPKWIGETLNRLSVKMIGASSAEKDDPNEQQEYSAVGYWEESK